MNKKKVPSKEFDPKDLSRRTPGEKLWLVRKAAGLTQAEAGRRAGIGENAVGEAEKDRRAAPAPLKQAVRAVSRPSLPLLLALARRRSGIGLAGVAEALGVSRVTVLAWEREGRPNLKAFWRGYGFRFP